MVVTMIVVGVVQVALDEIIDMVAVGHRLVPAIGAVFVRDLVTAAIVVGCAARTLVEGSLVDLDQNNRSEKQLVSQEVDRLQDPPD